MVSGAHANETTNTQKTPHPVIGKASYYARHFNGKKTASGERMNPNQLTAASKTIPLGTKVQVTNLENGKIVHVTINDRGPYVRGRVIDLTRRAAQALDMSHQGTARVEIRQEPEEPIIQEASALPPSLPPGSN
jgi:rare lipoprotein A (peptidoglycan hydrolase)